MKNVIFSLAVMATAIVCAEEATNTLSVAEREARREKLVMEKHGGYVTQPGTPSGSIIVINAQKRVDASCFDAQKLKTARRFSSLVKVIEGKPATVQTAAQLKNEYKADFALFIVEDENLPISLLAVEEQWAIMNVTALAPKKASPAVVKNRAINEFSRVFGMLCGGMASQFKAPLTNYVKDVADLDLCQPELPVDYAARMIQYIEYRGVKPEKKLFYDRACEQGWAPAPTNEVQRAIWDKVHELPTEPIEILPEKTPVKE